MSGHALTGLVERDGLWLVFAVVALQALGAPLPGTTALIAAAVYAAATHRLSIVAVILVGTLGALAGTCGGYLLGRLGGERLLAGLARRLRQPPDRLERVREGLARHGGIWLLLARHVTGARNVAGLVAGASGMAPRRFVAWSAAAALVWSTVASLEYYLFGAALLHAATWLQVLVVVAGVATTVLGARFAHRRAQRSLAQAPDGP